MLWVVSSMTSVREMWMNEEYYFLLTFTWMSSLWRTLRSWPGHRRQCPPPGSSRPPPRQSTSLRGWSWRACVRNVSLRIWSLTSQMHKANLVCNSRSGERENSHVVSNWRAKIFHHLWKSISSCICIQLYIIFNNRISYYYIWSNRTIVTNYNIFFYNWICIIFFVSVWLYVDSCTGWGWSLYCRMPHAQYIPCCPSSVQLRVQLYDKSTH